MISDFAANEKPSDGIDYCYFLNNDLTNARVRREDCKDRCASTPRMRYRCIDFDFDSKHFVLPLDCTHFTWTNFNEGTCWMKRSRVSAIDAHKSVDKLAVCGIVDNFSHITWNGNDSACGCDFDGNDLADVKTTTSHECNNRCASSKGMNVSM